MPAIFLSIWNGARKVTEKIIQGLVYPFWKRKELFKRLIERELLFFMCHDSLFHKDPDL